MNIEIEIVGLQMIAHWSDHRVTTVRLERRSTRATAAPHDAASIPSSGGFLRSSPLKRNFTTNSEIQSTPITNRSYRRSSATTAILLRAAGVTKSAVSECALKSGTSVVRGMTTVAGLHDTKTAAKSIARKGVTIARSCWNASPTWTLRSMNFREATRTETTSKRSFRSLCFVIITFERLQWPTLQWDVPYL